MISRTFDMRQISRKEFLSAVHEGDRLAQEEFGYYVREIVNASPTTTTVTWKQVAQQPPPQAMINIAADVIQAQTEINQEQRRMSNITGASLLGQQFRDHLANVKKQLDQAGQEMQTAMSDLSDTAQQAQDAVKQVKQETADLKAALGLNTNGPPA